MATPSEYPPAEFCRKYGRLLAPNGALLSPERAFALYKGADEHVQEKTRKALKVTLKRLRRSARVCVACGKPAGEWVLWRRGRDVLISYRRRQVEVANCRQGVRRSGPDSMPW